jgi:sarcosine oxidase
MSSRAARSSGTRSTDHDLVVVGLGGIGSAAACWAASRSGTRVLGIEQFALDHPHGASDDVSRIIRLSYHRPDYVRLARRAYAAWVEVEELAGSRIVTPTGGLDIFPPGAAIDPSDYTAAMTAEGVPHEVLDTAQVARRWPQWRIPDDTRTLYQADGGIADPSVGNAAHRRLASAAGATLVDRTRVATIGDHGGELVIETAAGERLTAGRVVIAADAWTNDLLASFDVDLPLTITQEQVAWFEPADRAAFEPGRFPIWIWMDDPSFYGFPTHAAPGPKIGQDVGGREVTTETRTYDPDPDALARLETFRDRHLPALGGLVRAKTCLYTLTPDRDFVVDTVPGHPHVVVILGAAHAYKFASLLGRVGAELALDGETASVPDIGAFAIDREALRDPSTPSRFLV